MSKKKAGEKRRGPKGGIKHQPGRGHDPKSGPARRERFARKAAKKRAEKEGEARKQWEEWNQLTDEQKKLLPELEPKVPRPDDED
jgi:hypothetical protein